MFFQRLALLRVELKVDWPAAAGRCQKQSPKAQDGGVRHRTRSKRGSKAASSANALRSRRGDRSTCAPLWLDYYRIPESQSHWTFAILPATTSTSKGPQWPIPSLFPLIETL